MVVFFCVRFNTGSSNLKTFISFSASVTSKNTVESHCDFDLHLLDDKLSWAILDTFIGYLEFCVGEFFTRFPVGNSFVFLELKLSCFFFFFSVCTAEASTKPRLLIGGAP